MRSSPILKYTLCIHEELRFERLVISESLKIMIHLASHVKAYLENEGRLAKLWIEGGKESLFYPVLGFEDNEVITIRQLLLPHSYTTNSQALSSPVSSIPSDV